MRLLTRPQLALNGKDLLVQAKTGTGKWHSSNLHPPPDLPPALTKAKLSRFSSLPSNASSSRQLLCVEYQSLSSRQPENWHCKYASSSIFVLQFHLLTLVSSAQIEDEAKILLKNHPFKVQHAIGGTKSVLPSRLTHLMLPKCPCLFSFNPSLLSRLHFQKHKYRKKPHRLLTLRYPYRHPRAPPRPPPK